MVELGLRLVMGGGVPKSSMLSTTMLSPAPVVDSDGSGVDNDSDKHNDTTIGDHRMGEDGEDKDDEEELDHEP